MSGNPVEGGMAFTGGGFLWTIDPGGAGDLAALEDVLSRWGRLPMEPGAAVLKRNIRRTVVLLDPRPRTAEGPPATAVRGGGRWVLKQYRYARVLERLRFRLTLSPAEREWRALRRLRSLGFRAPRPIAFGERRVKGVPVEGGLIMEEVPEAILFIDRLAAALDGARGEALPAGAADLLAGMGKLLRSLQDRGVDQFDLHAGNFLVQGGGPEAGPIHLIDVHSTRFRRRLSGSRRRAGLSKLVYSLRLLVPRTGVRRLIAGYLGIAAGGDSTAVDRLEQEVARRIARLEKRRLRSRSLRCVVESTSFAVERAPGRKVFRRREVPPEHLARLFIDRPSFPRIKTDRRGWVGIAAVDGREYLVKRRRYSLLAGVLAIPGSHRLRRAYRAGFALEVRGVATPRVLALGEERLLGVVRGAWLVAEPVGGCVTMVEHLASLYLGRPPPRGAAAAGKFLLARRVGELIRAVHDAGISTQDLSPQTILVDPSSLEAEGGAGPGAIAAPPRRAAVLIADLDSVHLWRRPGVRRRMRNLVQAGNLPEGHITWADRRRALRAYARGDEWLLSRRVAGELRESLLREAERTLDRMVRAIGE